MSVVSRQVVVLLERTAKVLLLLMIPLYPWRGQFFDFADFFVRYAVMKYAYARLQKHDFLF